MKVFCQKIYTKKHSVEITVIGYFLMVISDFFNMRSKDWPLEKETKVQAGFENKKFVYNSKQCFAFKPKTNFPAHNLDFR